MSSEVRSRLAQLSQEERKLLLERVLKTRQAEGRREIAPQPRTGSTFPLSYAQQRIWFLQQLLPPGSTAFHVGQSFRVRGPLDRAALERSLSRIIQRHEALRTTFELHDGEPVQRIRRDGISVGYDDLSAMAPAAQPPELRRRAWECVLGGWDLGSGPLIRAHVWRLGEEDHALVLALHHIVCDWWSMNILAPEVFAAYEADVAGREPLLPKVAAQCADFAIWQRQWTESEGFRQQLATWQRRLAGVPRLRLSRIEGAAARGGLGRSVDLTAEQTRRVRALNQAERATTFMTLLSAFAVLLSRYSDQDDIVIGSPLANRHRAELENVIGCFMNPLPFRLDLSGNPTFRELLRRVRAEALDVYSRQDVPFDLLARGLESRREGAAPLFQAMFMVNAPSVGFDARRAADAGSAAPATLRVEPWSLLAAAGDGHEAELKLEPMYPIALELTDGADVITGHLQYVPEYAKALGHAPEHFCNLVDAAVSNPDLRVSDLRFSSPDEQRMIARQSAAPAARRPVEDVSVAFAAQVERTPHATALVGGGRQLTYRELQGCVGRLAAQIRAEGVGPETAVGVFLERSVEAVIAVLAVLEAGAAYVPLDPALPGERLGRMMDHARVGLALTRRAILGDSGLAPLIAGRRVLLLDDASQDAVTPSASLPDGGAVAGAAIPEQLAYVLYTSGSTGVPKAVAIPRGALSNYVRDARERFGLTPRDRVLQFASFNFDTAAEEIFPTLTSGAALVLRDEKMLASIPAFLESSREWGITVLNFPTAYWHELTAQIVRGGLALPETIRLVILGGEKVLADRVREWRARVPSRVRVLNTYGPTETTVVATAFEIGELGETFDEVPIGRAVTNVEAHVTSAAMDLAPVGVVGELCVSGSGVGRGYLHDPALTAERFVPNPFSGEPGARMYRTGDLARLTADHRLEFVGRRDDQIKLRGYRIELGEVESVLLQQEGLLEAAVTVREDRPGDRRLVAYAVPFAGTTVAAADVRTFLQARLPEYMMPSAIVFLARLPRSVQQKVDRSALPPPDPGAAAEDAYHPPQTELERRIAALWAEVLQRDRIGLHDNFFDLGGHSLLVIQLHAKLCETLGDDLSLVDLFQYPTVFSQAGRIGGQAAPDVAFGAIRDRAARQRQAYRRSVR